MSHEEESMKDLLNNYEKSKSTDIHRKCPDSCPDKKTYLEALGKTDCSNLKEGCPMKHSRECPNPKCENGSVRIPEESIEYLPCGVCYPNIYSSKQKLKTLIMPYCEFDEDNAEKVIQEVVRVIDKTRPELIINQKLNSTVVDRTLDYLMEVINGNKD